MFLAASPCGENTLQSPHSVANIISIIFLTWTIMKVLSCCSSKCYSPLRPVFLTGGLGVGTVCSPHQFIIVTNRNQKEYKLYLSVLRILECRGTRCSSVVEHLLILCDGSSDRSLMVDPLSYFSFQPVLHNWCNKEGRKEMFYLMMHSTHFIYSYLVSDIW